MLERAKKVQCLKLKCSEDQSIDLMQCFYKGGGENNQVGSVTCHISRFWPGETSWR